MKQFAKLIALTLALVLALTLTACKKQEEVKAPTVARVPAENEATATAAPYEPAVTPAPATDAPETEPPATDAPETEPPATDAPETGTPETQAPVTVNPGDNSALVGLWQSEITWEQMEEMNDGGMDDGSMDLFFSLVGENNLCMDLEFTADGKLTISMDRASAEAMVDALFNNLPSLLPELTGMSEEELTEMLEEQGMTMDDFMDLILGDVNKDELLEGLDDSSTTGAYVVDGDRIYVCEEGETPDSNSNYMVYTRNGDTLTLVEFVGNGDELDSIESLLPWTFTRIG